MRTLAAWIALPLCLLGCHLDELVAPGSEEWSPPSSAAQPATLVPREPCESRTPGGRAFFGDLHVHTALSMDTVIRAGISTPDMAYRFARGQEIGLPPLGADGEPTRALRLQPPLDFAAVTDHAEWLGETSLCTRPGSDVYESEGCRLFRGEERSWMGDGLFARIIPLVGLFGRNTDLCGEDGLRCRDELLRAWDQTRAAAERWYDRTSACSFTTFHAWEYSASPKRSKVHRNVILRNEIAPELPISSIDEPSAEGLWEKLDARCNSTGTGCEAIAIPHNPNVSNGQMFVPDRSGSDEAQRARAALRARMEPLVEMVQAKGESECRNGFASVLGEDEICDLDKVRFVEGAQPPDCGDESGGGAMASRGCQSRYDFARFTLIEGLREEAKLGVNPYRHGWIGGTDTHNGTPGATDEASYPGHNGVTDATLQERIGGDSGGGYVQNPLRSPGGLAGIWAEENTRDALFDAMKRRETFATSGTRITPRLIASAARPEGFCSDAPIEGGIPMGGVLEVPADASPWFTVSALQDPGTDGLPGTLLQRIQIVKGWAGDDGKLHQRVFDVAGHAPGLASVDRETCSPSGPGSATLCAVWTDEEFDPAQPAIYYARVLENPSCRWTGHQCATVPPDERPAACDDPTIPWQSQERAWTSAIWIAPGP
jgi:hypothetical protein